MCAPVLYIDGYAHIAVDGSQWQGGREHIPDVGANHREYEGNIPFSAHSVVLPRLNCVLAW
eukprot:3778096-Pyramimonas_sp.AAC.1